MKHLRALGLLVACTTSLLTACSPSGAVPAPDGGEPTPTGTDAGTGAHAEITDAAPPPSAPPAPAPPASLEVTELLAPGGECRYGGRVTRVGLDRDGDGVLDAGETERRDVRCAMGYAERTIAVDPGDECLGGGVRVQRGFDTNQNGALEDGEVATTELVCGRVVTGDLVLTTKEDVEAAADVAAVTGNVDVRCREAIVVRLPALRVVEMDLRLRDSAVTELDAPVLARVGVAVTARGASGLERLTLPALVSADYVSLTDVPRLAALSLPAVTELGGIVVDHADALATVSLPLLERTGQLSLAHLPKPVTYTWPRLRQVSSGMSLYALGGPLELRATSLGFLHVAGGRALSVSFPDLLGIESDLVLRNETLRTFHAPNLKRIGGDLSIDAVAELDAFTLAKLERVEGLHVGGNATLGILSFPALRGYVGVVSIVNNGSLGHLRGLSGITEIGNLYLGGPDSVLSDLSALSVERAGAVQVALPVRTMALPKLRIVDELRIGVNSHPNRVTLAVELPELESAGVLHVTDLNVAERLVAPKLRSISGTLLVTRSPKIPTCDTNRLLDGLTTKPSTMTLVGTDPSAACSSPLPP